MESSKGFKFFGAAGVRLLLLKGGQKQASDPNPSVSDLMLRLINNWKGWLQPRHTGPVMADGWCKLSVSELCFSCWPQASARSSTPAGLVWVVPWHQERGLTPPLWTRGASQRRSSKAASGDQWRDGKPSPGKQAKHHLASKNCPQDPEKYWKGRQLLGPD